jgi:O-antigen ligase
MFKTILQWLFLITVMLAPLPFASNRPWSWSLLCALVGVLVIGEAINTLISRSSHQQFIKRIAPGFIMFTVVSAWIVFQTMSGMSDDIAHPLFSEASALIGAPSLSAMSVDPNAGMMALMRLLTYAGVFWLAARLCRDKDFASTTLRVFVTISGVYALYGLIVFFLDLNMILWFEKWAYHGVLTSTFINRNTYATFAGLGVLASITLGFELISRKLHHDLSYRETVKVFLDEVFAKAWMPFLCLLLTATALLLTHSRGGFLSTSLAILVLLLALSYARIIPRKISYVITGLVLFSSIFAFSMSGDIVTKRLEHTSFETSLRDEVYSQTIEAINLNPLLGTGYGTYEKAFMAYKTVDIFQLNWDKAHNSYLELAMELGIPATVILCAIFLWLSGVFFYGLIRRRRKKMYAALGLAATALVAAHAMVDFSLQIPGFTVSYALIAGLAWSQSWPTRRTQKSKEA